jgi:hypothetical protein
MTFQSAMRGLAYTLALLGSSAAHAQSSAQLNILGIVSVMGREGTASARSHFRGPT